MKTIWLWLFLLLLVSSNALPSEPLLWQHSQLTSKTFGAEIPLWRMGSDKLPVIILIHGLGQSAHNDWSDIVPTLAQQFHVITFDLPGFGEAPTVQPLLSPTNYAKLIDEIARQFSQQPVTVIGHSMGGAIALRYAADYPPQLKKLILVDVAGVLNKVSFMQHFSQFNTQLLPITLPPIAAIQRKLRDLTGSVLEGPESLVDWSQFLLMQPQLKKQLLGERGNIEASFLMITEDFGESLPTIHVDTHVLWGADDGIAPLRTAHLLAQRMPNAAMHIIAGAAHVPMRENPAEFMRQLQLSLAIPASTLKVAMADSNSRGEFNCNNQQALKLSGRYDTMQFNSCHDIQLIDVKAKRLVLMNSSLTAINLTVDSPETAIHCHNSYAEVTNGSLRGTMLFELGRCRIDLAGVDMEVRDRLATITEQSSLRFSICSLKNKHGSKRLHKNVRLQQQNLNDDLPQK